MKPGQVILLEDISINVVIKLFQSMLDMEVNISLVNWSCRALVKLEKPLIWVDIFRKPEAVPQIIEDSLAKLKGIKTIWMQIGIKHESAAKKARDLGLKVVEDRCPKIEHQRLFGEL